MQVHVEEISAVLKKVNIEIPVEQVDAEIEKFYAGIQKNTKLHGFRPGKAPMQLVKRTYRDSMPGRVTHQIYEQTLFKVLQEHSIEAIDSPSIEGENLEQGVPFKFSALVEVIPEIHLKEYTGLAVTKELSVSNPDSIDLELKRMQENMAQLIPLGEDAVVENAHVVLVDYSFTVEGCPEEKSNTKDAEVDVGANRQIPGFEEQLIGMKCGASKEIRVTLPVGYRYSKVDGKEGIFLVTLKEIKRKELPELNDEFARRCGPYETMQQLRENLQKNHEKNEAIRIENELKDRVIQALIEKNPLDVPKSMVKRQLDHMLEIFKKSQQLSVEMINVDDNGFRDHYRDAAADRAKGRLLLTALVEKVNISVEVGDLAKRYEMIAAGNSDSFDLVKGYYESNPAAKMSLLAEIKEDKAITYLLDHAVITEVSTRTVR
ncbi:MAG: trigger factor [Desulfuromonadales bacterium]